MKSFKGIWITLLLALAMVITCIPMSMSSVFADAGDEPAHTKTRNPNGDGTHKIELTVTGDADDDKQEAGDVNVLVIYDISQSMSTQAGSSSNSRADEAENVMHDFLTNLAAFQNDDEDNIRVALVNFSTNATTVQGWTTNVTGLANRFADGVGPQAPGVNFTYNGMGTNWEIAFRQGRTLVRSITQQNDDPTFVIFLTDGAPTDSESHSAIAPTGASIGDLRARYHEAIDEANDVWEETEATGGALYGIYAYGTEADLLDDLMYAAESGNDRPGYPDSVRRETDDANHYYNAGETAQLQAAIDEIFNEVVNALGITQVSMSDGTTNQVTVSSGEVTSSVELLGVDEDSYQYWMDFPIVNNSFTRTKNVGGKAEEITYTISPGSNGNVTITWTEGGQNKSVTVKGTVSGGHFKYEWEEANDFYEFAPNEAELKDNGAVDWDLSNVGVLLDGVTYSVTFDVYPSQTALDYKARLDNGEAYEDVVPEEAREYFDSNGNLETNTEGKLTYSDTRLDNPGPKEAGYDRPPKIKTESITMDIEKEWEGANPPTLPDGLDVDVLMDGDDFYVSNLKADDWADEFHISCGLIRGEEALEDAKGHDFSFAELGNEQYRWELHAPVVRPMIINGAETPTMLIKVDEKNGYTPEEGMKVYTIDGADYYVDPAVTSLQATNHRRSNLNLKKVLSEGSDEAPDAEFPFTLTVNNIKAPESEPEDDPDHNSDYWVWFSIEDAEGNKVTEDAKVENATPSGDYFYAKSGDPISLVMKEGWNLRFTNLPTGTTYTFVEGDSSGCKFISAELNTDVVADSTFSGGKTTTGTIEEYNNKAYEVTYTNEYKTVDVTVTKEWDDGSDQDKIRPDDLALTLNNVPSDFTAPDPKVTKNGNSWTYTWKGLPKYDAQGQDITYTVSEQTAPEGYTIRGNSTVNSGGTITNVHTPETVNVTITKVWEGDSGISSNVRPASIQAQLKANGTNSGNPVTLDEDSDWSYTWENLPKNNNGTAINYTVDETAVPTGYTKTGPVKKETDTGYEYTVTNTYNPTPVVVDPPVQKIITGTDLLHNNSAFTFTIENTSCPDGVTAPMPANTSITNSAQYELSDKEGYYEFGEIAFTVPGEYVYTVKETGSAPGVTNDSAAADGKTLTFVVAFDDEGKLTVSPPTAQAQWSFTNVYDATGSIVLKAKKVLRGDKALAADDFSFSVYDADNNVVATGSNDADGLVTFSAITGFTLADVGEVFSYTIKENIPEGATGNPPKLGTITYDNSEKPVTVTVSDQGTGTLIVEADKAEADLVFENTYTPAEGSTSITVNKTLDGRKIQAGEFSFKMVKTGGPEGGDSITADGLTAVLTAEGISSSGTTGSTTLPITYKEKGTYTYTITENVPSENPHLGVTYDTHSEEITVEVVDSDGQLVATPSKTSVEFENSYETKGDGQIDIVKVFEGKNWTDEEFTFALYDSEGTQIGENKTLTKEDLDDEGNAKGSFVLTDLTPGTYTYTVKELGPSSSSEAGENSDEQAPADNENTDQNTDQTEENTDTPTNRGVVSETSDVEETDEETPEEAPAEPTAEEPAAAEDENSVSALFRSLLLTAYAEDEPVTEETENGIITYDQTGTGNGYTVTVNVTDNLDGTCTVEVEYPSGTVVKFTNQYVPNPATVNLEATKTLTGKELTEGMFQFKLSGNGVNETVANNAEGKATFPQLSYTVADAGKTYKYKVEEVNGGLTGITYDKNTYEVTVTVSYDADAGKLSASVSDNAKSLSFTNTYKPEDVSIKLQATKTLIGADLKAGQFSFVILDKDGVVRASGTNDASGKVSFGALVFSDEGTFNYTIQEVDTGDENITYDTNSFPVTITVTDKDGRYSADVSFPGGAAEFVNTYTPPEEPEEPDKPKKVDTGDSNDLAGMLGLMASSAAGLVYMFIRRRREENM